MPLDIQNIHVLQVNKQSQYRIFFVINAFAIIPKKLFSCTLNTTNGLYILETYNVMQIFVAICKKTLEFNIKMHGMQIFDESRSFGLFQVVTLVLFEVSNLQSYY